MSAKDGHTAGLLLAAGRSTRMGRLKQTLPWPPRESPGGDEGRVPGGSTIIAASFDLIAAFCSCMFIVMDTGRDAIVEALGSRDYEGVSGDGGLPMFDSIVRGLRAIEARDPELRRVLLHPADHPAVSPATIEHLLEAATAHPECVILPEHGGKGGHPVVIPRAMGATILADSGVGGLRRIWEKHPSRVMRLAVNDVGAVVDIDTREEYARNAGNAGQSG